MSMGMSPGHRRRSAPGHLARRRRDRCHGHLFVAGAHHHSADGVSESTYGEAEHTA